MQLTLFDVEERKSDSELIEQAYRLRNKDMGYSIAEEKENIPNEVIYHRFY